MFKYICYNWSPTISNHAIDFDEGFYNSVGVTRLHDFKGFNPDSMVDGDVLFVKTDFIYNKKFQFEVLPRIKTKFILISAGSSYHIGSNGDYSYIKILNNENLIAWFCTNPPSINSDKIIPFPIGFEEKERPGGDQQLIEHFQKNKIDFQNKKDKVLLPYHDFNTNPKRRSEYELLRGKSFVEVQEQKLPWKEYLTLLNEYKYVICFEGSGPDVHRNYETLLVNSVPICRLNTTKKMFDYHNLPVVFVDQWDRLDEKFYEGLQNNNFNFKNSDEFLTMKYHTNLINSYR